MSLEIKNFADLLKNHVKGEIVRVQVSRLTAPGENYGSLMLKADATVKINGREEVIHTVAKCVPTSKEMQKIFNIETTFKNEIGWYEEAIPALLEFQREQGVPVADYFMNIYAARLSLDPTKEVVDDDGVILCENLAVKGYRNANRRTGFTLEQTKEVLRKVASFHATTIALKLRKPEIFNHKVKRFLSILESHKEPKISLFTAILDALKENPETSSLVPKVIECLTNNTNSIKDLNKTWATATHTDLWVNNIMLKDEENEKPPKVIILDLQTCGYGSPVADLLFFLATSIDTPVADKNFDDLLRFYYDELVSNLQALKADLSEFSYENFQQELQNIAPGQLEHCIFMTAIILAEKDDVSETDNFSPEKDLTRIMNNVSEVHRAKYCYIVKKFAEHGWI